MIHLGQQVIWHGIPFGPFTGTNTFLPVESFTIRTGVKLEADEENGITKVTGRELQTACLSIRVQSVAGADPRATFEALNALKGLSAGIYMANGLSGSLATAALDALQTSDWSTLFSLDTAAKVLAGTSAGNCAFMLTAVDMDARGIDAHGTIYDAVITLSFTEDASQAQTGGLVVEVNGKDITKKIAVEQCWYETHADGQPDCLTLVFADTKNEWVGWAPSNGASLGDDERGKTGDCDKIRVTDGALDTGKLYIESMRPENGSYKVVAYSVPHEAYRVKSRSFNGANIPTLAAKIAQDAGLRCKAYGVPETAIQHVQQVGKSDLAFLHDICRSHGCGFIVFDGTLCVYSAAYLEGKEAAYKLVPGVRDTVDITTSGGAAYSSCTLSNGYLTGTATAPGNGREWRETVQAAWQSDADANAAAAARLRELNRDGKTAKIEMPTQRRLCAGCIVTLVCRGWLGKAFLYRVRHDLARKRSTIWARKPLDF